MKYFYILLLLALPSIVFAQSNYHEGYVIKNNGDTLKGFIDYHEWDQNPISVDFEINKDDKQPKQFSPSLIKEFCITGMVTYFSYNGMISNDKNRFPDLNFFLDTSKVNGSIFLKEITTGSHLSLYTQVDGIKTRYFVAEENAVPVELKYNQYYTDRQDVIERAFFRGQLILYINKYIPGKTALISQAEETKFEDDRLENIIYKINGDSIAKTNQSKQSKVRGYIGLGILNTKIQVDGTKFHSISTLPQINFGVDIFDNPDVQQHIIRVNGSLSFASAKIAYGLSGSQNRILSFDQFTVGIAPQIIYNIYNRDNFKVYIDGGVGLNFSSYSHDSDIPSTAFNSFWTNLPLQTGIVINKKWEASFTYAPYLKIADTGFTYQSFSLGVKLYLDNLR